MLVRVLVDEHGKVKSVEIMNEKSVMAPFRMEARRVVKRYRFRPAYHMGVPVKTYVQIALPFPPNAQVCQ